jgi:hypothetical protein
MFQAEGKGSCYAKNYKIKLAHCWIICIVSTSHRVLRLPSSCSLQSLLLLPSYHLSRAGLSHLPVRPSRMSQYSNHHPTGLAAPVATLVVFCLIKTASKGRPPYWLLRRTTHQMANTSRFFRAKIWVLLGSKFPRHTSTVIRV